MNISTFLVLMARMAEQARLDAYVYQHDRQGTEADAHMLPVSIKILIAAN